MTRRLKISTAIQVPASFNHQPTKAMSETIQRYECGSNCMSADAEGYYVTFEDHQSALAAVQAEVEKLREESSRIIGERRARAAVHAFNLETT
jgi:hypothetical protein